MQAYKRNLLKLTLSSLLATALNQAVWAQNSAKPDQTHINALYQQSNAALQAKKYSEAAELYSRVFTLDAANGDAAYNAACAYALMGEADLAFAWLDKAIQAGYLDLEHAQKDSDLDSLRKDARWTLLTTRMDDRRKYQARLWDSDVWKSPYQEQLSEDERIAGLSKFWSEVKYNFVYTQTLRDLDWDAVYLRYLPKVKAARSTAEYYLVLMEMCALLKDAHTNVYPPESLYDTVFAKPDFSTEFIENRVLINRVHDDHLKQQGVVHGTEITHVNGIPVQDYMLQTQGAVISASTPQDKNTRLFSYQFLMGPIAEKLSLTLRDADGKEKKVTSDRVTYQQRHGSGTGPFSWRMLPGQIAYVALNSFGDDTAAKAYLKAFPEISKAKAIIFDVRRNGGGSGDVGFRILKTLSTKPFAISHAATRNYLPAMRAWGRPDSMHHFPDGLLQTDPAHQFSGKVVVLTSAMTFSAAEDFAVAFDGMKRGVMMGEATGGSTGQPLMLSLPGGGRARICTKQDTYPDGKAFVGVGVQPHIVIHPTVADFRANRDTVLEAAIAEVNK